MDKFIEVSMPNFLQMRFFFFLMFIFERERETKQEGEGYGERRHRGPEAGSELTAVSTMQGLNSRTLRS